jgi:hypothetical protein
MRRRVVTSRGLVLTLAVLVWLTIAAVLAAWPLLTDSGGQRPPASADRAPAPSPAPSLSADAIARVQPRLAVHGRVAVFAPGGLRLRVSTTGAFRPTPDTPARLRVVLSTTGRAEAARSDRIVRRVALTGAARSAVFRHLAPGTWRWEVDAVPDWKHAVVSRDSGRVVIAAPPPAPAPPAPPESAPATTVDAAAKAPASSGPAYGSEPPATSAPSDGTAAPSPDPVPTRVGGGGGGGGGPHDEPAAPFGGGGSPIPEGPHAP